MSVVVNLAAYRATRAKGRSDATTAYSEVHCPICAKLIGPSSVAFSVTHGNEVMYSCEGVDEGGVLHHAPLVWSISADEVAVL